MTLLKFKSLPKKQKKTVVLRTGSFLSEKNYGLYRKMLYQVDGFYVEIYFTRFTKEPFLYRSFASTNQLKSYLKEIDISVLLKDVLITD